jgi:hypothetical protein
MMPRPSGKFLRRAGSGIGLLGVAFVAVKLRSYGATLAPQRFGIDAWTALAVLVFLYGCSGSLLALAWRDLLRHFDAAVSPGWALSTYGISQIAKYLPGNIFHLLSRQAIGAAAGIPAWTLAKSSLWELGLLCITGSLFCILAVPLVFAGIDPGVAATLFSVALFTCTGIALRVFGLPLARIICWHAAFLTHSGAIFAGVLFIIAPGMHLAPLLPALVGAYGVAWLAGLITPGAPAGVGVREIVLFALLQSVVTQADLLMAIVLARAVTVLGDFVFYLIASICSFTGISGSSRLRSARPPRNPLI